MIMLASWSRARNYHQPKEKKSMAMPPDAVKLWLIKIIKQHGPVDLPESVAKLDWDGVLQYCGRALAKLKGTSGAEVNNIPGLPARYRLTSDARGVASGGEDVTQAEKPGPRFGRSPAYAGIPMSLDTWEEKYRRREDELARKRQQREARDAGPRIEAFFETLR
jgi:hypothetical protein